MLLKQIEILLLIIKIHYKNTNNKSMSNFSVLRNITFNELT